MKARWFGVVILALLAVGVMPLIASCDLNPRATPATGGDVNAFKAALEKDGFTVQEGQLVKFDLVPLCCAGKTPTCMANNAGAPYMTFLLPKAPAQTAENTLPWVFRLGADEAAIIVGRTPPPMAYYSYQPFRMIVYSEREAAPKIIFEPLGDTINNLAIQTDGPAVEPFNRNVLIIITADRGVDKRVRAAAGAAGYPAGLVNTSVVPTALTRLGVDQQSDEFALVHRMFLPSQEQAMVDYQNTPQVVLRITPKTSGPRDPFPVPELRVRGTGSTEMDLLPAVEDLRKAILAKHSGWSATELTTSVWLTDGYDGMQREINQYGPTRDTLYLRTDPFFKLTDSPDDFVLVYGVNHEATGKATYSNLSVYADPNLLLGMVSENSRRFAGSAKDYLPNHPQADKLYAWKVARNCQGDPHCLEVKLSVDCARLSLDALPDLWMAFRAYLEPKTKVGPAFTEVAYDRAIHFSRVR